MITIEIKDQQKCFSSLMINLELLFQIGGHACPKKINLAFASKYFLILTPFESMLALKCKIIQNCSKTISHKVTKSKK